MSAHSLPLLFSLFIFPVRVLLFFFFFNDTATTEIYTLSLHDALPIYPGNGAENDRRNAVLHHDADLLRQRRAAYRDRKSTRLNSSHQIISYAVFCLKKKKKKNKKQEITLGDAAKHGSAEQTKIERIST